MQRGSAREVLQVFLRLGCTSFGGPVAHVAYFRRELVERRGWLGESAYAELVGLSQFLPGPASSKVGLSLGLLRAGWLGGLAAWIGFTAPSAILMVLFASGVFALSDSAAGQGLLHGLKLTAVAIVAQAVWSMARTLCPDRGRAVIGIIALALTLTAPTRMGQLTSIVFGAMAGLMFCRAGAQAPVEPLQFSISHRVGAIAIVMFAVLLAVSFLPAGDSILAVFNAFYRSGALVFGGGHVVLPLLSEAVVTPGWVDSQSFLAGYGGAQALPGPLFTFAAFLGSSLHGPVSGGIGAGIALVAIFLPGALLQIGAIAFWNAIRSREWMRAAMRGINAAVVGLLAAALYDPVWTGSVFGPADFIVALVGFALLTFWRTSPLLVVALTAAAGVTFAVI